MKSVVCAAVALSSSLGLVAADCYMHNPRGSNDRNCETSNNENRNNGNRLFDSQNNDKGGYSCPLARPFPCYQILDDTQRATCNAKNSQNPTADMVDAYGVKDPTGTRTPRMYYYEGSILPIEWTTQHGCGDNPRVKCQIILQYACEDTLTDVCNCPTPGASCGPRDGVPVTNLDTIATSTRDAQATDTIPSNNNNGEQCDNRYGRHETLTYYTNCKTRARNTGLFLADRNLNGNTAIYTRQNNNGNRNGLECPEERDYWPYWHSSPWKDIAILTSDVTQCATLPSQSQNVVSKNECSCPTCTGDIPNNQRDCVKNGGTWTVIPAYNIPPPYCGPVQTTRENQLGNPVGATAAGLASHYNWTLPTGLVSAESCVLRIRYNISADDMNQADIVGDASLNGFFSPIHDRTTSENKAYAGFADITDSGLQTHAKLGLAVNTNQYGRTFQDRSYMFSIRKAPQTGPCAGQTIYNLNVRGKRGNIVDVYPAVEYDFVPNRLVVSQADCLHLQWTGSDYNPDREPNAAYGGPPSPLNMNEAKSDRHNLVQSGLSNSINWNTPVSDFNSFNMFNINIQQKMSLAFINQPISDPTMCMNITEIKLNFPNLDQNGRDRIHYNCGKLSGAIIPYYDGGLVQAAGIGTYNYMSTRDNSFTNRDMKGTLTVTAGLNTAAAAGVGVVAAAVGCAAVFGLFVLYRRRRSSATARPASLEKPNLAAAEAGLIKKNNTEEKAMPPPKEKKSSFTPVQAPAPAKAAPASAAAVPVVTKAAAAATETCIALYDHEASEPGELNFKKGDKITVLKKDDSGWWEGQVGKARGIFPANYVKL